MTATRQVNPYPALSTALSIERDISASYQRYMALAHQRGYWHRQSTNSTTLRGPAESDFGSKGLVATDLDASYREYAWDLSDALIRLTFRPSGSTIGGSMYGYVAAADRLTVAKYMLAIHQRYPSIDIAERKVRTDFWYQTPGGSTYVQRDLDAPLWREVAANYSQAVREHLAKMVSPLWRPDGAGKMILWYGPPGTGKTFAIRALVREWMAWCKVSYVTDPENFLGSPAYMMNVILNATRPGEVAKPWQLVILEDSGELLTKGAKDRTGQALSRLLNLTDGFVGQGLGLMLLVTANEEYENLHEAVVRPGRCLSRVPFGSLSQLDARAWLDAQGHGSLKVHSEATLADLYAMLRGDDGRIVPERKAVGFGAAVPA